MSAVTEPSCVEASGCCSSQSLLAGEASDDAGIIIIVPKRGKDPLARTQKCN